MIGHFSRMRTGGVFFKYANEDFNNVGILENFENCSIHTQVFDGFEHMDETFGFEKLARS